MVSDSTASLSGSTDILALILFGVIAVVLIIALIYIIKMWRRNYLRNRVKFNIIFPDGSSDSKFIKNPKKVNRIGKCAYVFKHKALIKRRFYKEIFYNVGDVEPIIFPNIDNRSGITPNEFDTIIQERITEKLFSTEEIDKKDIMLFIIIGICAITLFMVYEMKSKGVVPSTEGLSFIADAFRSVINGG